MSDQPAGVTPPSPDTPSIPVSATSDNPGVPSQPAPGTPPAHGQAAPGQHPQGQYGQGQQAYGAPPAPPAPKQPNPFVENLKADLIGTFPTPTDAPQGKLWAILSYLPGVFIPLWLVPLVRRNNHLSLFHAKQMLAFAAFQIPTSFVFFLVRSLLPKGQVWNILGLIGSIMLGLAFLAVAVVGLLGAIKGQVKPLPLIGRFADRLLRSLTVCPPVANAEPQLAYWQRVAPVAARPQQPYPAQAPQQGAGQPAQGWPPPATASSPSGPSAPTAPGSQPPASSSPPNA